MDFSGYDLILTQNHRLSASLNTPIPVLSLSQWLEASLSTQLSGQTLLGSHQQYFVIKSVIQDLNPDYVGLAPLVQSAWNLCQHYLIEFTSPIFSKNDDTQLFQVLAQEIDAYYKENNLTDIYRQMANLRVPDKTALIGFSELTPLEQKVLKNGTAISLSQTTKSSTQWCYADPETELKTLILWAINQPTDKQIGCAIPDLEKYREKIMYYLDYLEVDPKRFTLSAVKKLSEYYFIQDCFEHFYPDETSHKPSEWVKKFRHQLEHSTFIHSRVLNSEEFQLNEKLKDIFKIYSHFDIANKTLSFDEAVSELKNLCSRVPFQGTASKTANIHFLSLLDSKGLTFDKLWVTGMDSRHWPNKTKANPFLPFPHVITEMRDWNNTATEIIYSYPKQVDEAATIPAKILENIPFKNIEYTWPMPTINSQMVGSQFIATVPVDISLLKHHGSSILKDHTACPFRAFAKHRLNAQTPDDIQMGLSALERGNLVHEVLEKTFQAIHSKEKLLSYSTEQLNDLIDAVITNALNKHKNIQEIFLLAEKARLQKLVIDWLELEKTRENFVVVATEKTLEAKLGNLPLKLRIDRIDQIAPNKYLIIDYKTSQYDIRGDYLDEPQLPLYAVVSTESIDKIAYAYLRTGNSKLKEIPVNYLKQQWETDLLKVAEDFLKGNAEVKPKYGEETCRMCDLKSLCRVNCLSQSSESSGIKEAQLLKNLNPYSAHADKLAKLSKKGIS